MRILNTVFIVMVLLVASAGAAYVIKNDMIRDYLPGQKVSEDEDDADETDDDTEEEKIHIIDGYKAIELDEEQLETVGIAAKQLSSMDFMPEFTAYAEVVDIAPLVSLRTEYENLQAEKKILQNALNNLQVTLKRSRALHKARSLSTRELEHHRAAVDQKQAELSAMNTRLENVEYKIRSEWGEVIADLVLDPEKKSGFNRLAMHRDSLVMLSLPKDKTLTDVEQDVYVSYTNRRDAAVQATYLDQARRPGNPLYGESYFYWIESEKLRPGMRLFAWIEATDESLKGLLVPEEAVIWYANEPWVYSQHDENTFVRKPLSNAVKIDGGWFVTGGIDEQEQIIIRGGQTLLSEEFKWAIPDEDDD